MFMSSSLQDHVESLLLVTRSSGGTEARSGEKSTSLMATSSWLLFYDSLHSARTVEILYGMHPSGCGHNGYIEVWS